MKLISFLIFMFAIALFIAYVIAILKPIFFQKLFKLSLTRGKALLGVLASICLFVVAIAISPEPKPLPSTVPVASKQDEMALLSNQLQKVHKLVSICDDGHKLIAKIQTSKSYNMKSYYDAAKATEEVCQGAWEKVKFGMSEKFQSEDYKALSNTLTNNASFYLTSKIKIAEQFKDMANTGKISLSDSSEMNDRLERSKSLAMKYALTKQEIETLTGSK